MQPHQLAMIQRQAQTLEEFVKKVNGGYHCMYAELQVTFSALHGRCSTMFDTLTYGAV